MPAQGYGVRSLDASQLGEAAGFLELGTLSGKAAHGFELGAPPQAPSEATAGFPVVMTLLGVVVWRSHVPGTLVAAAA